MSPDVNELKKWLKVSDLSQNDIVNILDGGRIKEFDFEDKQTKEKKTGSALEIGVSVNGGVRKGLTLNAMSIQSLSNAWGGNTDKWANKKAIADKTKMMSFGKLIDAVYLKPIPEDAQGWDEKTN